MDRKTFYKELRVSLGAVSQEAEAGMDLMLDRAQIDSIGANKLAYALATAWWETARTMQPVREAFFVSSDFAKAEAWRKKNLKYYPYYGRGYVQLTHSDNYKKAAKKIGVDFVANPDLVMKPEHAIEIMFSGMKEGWFTGKKLDDYIDDNDETDNEDWEEYRLARRIINGSDKARTIADLALAFERGLRSSGYSKSAPVVPGPLSVTNLDGSTGDFGRFIGGLNLRFFKAYEFLVKGASHNNPSSSAYLLNTDPPRDLWNNVADVARVIDEFRARVERPVTISSAYRSPAYNAAIGGASSSQHMQFRALDLSVAGSPVGPLQWANVLRDMRGSGIFSGGIGVYSSFVHVDTRGANVDWAG